MGRDLTEILEKRSCFARYPTLLHPTSKAGGDPGSQKARRMGHPGCWPLCDQDLRVDSMAAMTVGSSGRTSGEKRAATLPLRSMRNFSKFPRMPGSGLVE